jgi:hypothetical protein
MKRMDRSRKWLTSEVLWTSEQLSELRRLLADFSNPSRLLDGYLLLFGVAICHQAHQFHFDEKIRMSKNPIQNSEFSTKRKNHGQQELGNRGQEPHR